MLIKYFSKIDRAKNRIFNEHPGAKKINANANKITIAWLSKSSEIDLLKTFDGSSKILNSFNFNKENKLQLNKM